MKNTKILLILFCCLTSTLPAQNKIRQYEYWLDNDVSTKQIVIVTPATVLDLNSTIPINGLPSCMHRLNVRFLDTNNIYSTVYTQFIEAFASNQQIASYEFWTEDSYSNKTQVAVTPASNFNLNNLDLALIPAGMHTLFIRFADKNSKWSAIQHGRINISTGSALPGNSVSGYRYWIDSNFAGNIYKPVNGSSPLLYLSEMIDLTAFPKGGNHTLHIQFKDIMGFWSTVQSTGLMNSGGGGTFAFNVVSGYRYWIDNDFANSIYKDINPAYQSVSIDDHIDLKSFTGTGRLLNTQFKDALGLWSSVVTDTMNVEINVEQRDLFYERGDIHVYPNPNKGEFIVSTGHELKDAILNVSNTVGEIIYTQEINILTSNRIHLKNIEPGIYFVQIIDLPSGRSLKSTKIIIHK